MGRTKKASAAETAPVEVVSIKGFDKDFRCRDFQFEVGKTYSVEGRIVACENGFHAVDPENPMHVWDFYPVINDSGELTRYAEVVQSGDMDREVTEQGTKIASASIMVKAEITLPDFIRRAVNTLIAKTKAGASKDTAASGDYSQLAASGHSSQLAASGDYSKLAASGDSSKLAASGDSSKLAASGDSSVIASSSVSAIAKGGNGTWISLAEYDFNRKCIGFATGCIGQDGLLPDTWYRAEGGKLIPA